MKAAINNLKKGAAGAWLLAALGLLGILLIGFGDLPGKKPEPVPVLSVQEDTQELESRLQALVSQVEGAGKTAVMLTFEGSQEKVYALDTKSGQNGSEQEHVLLESGTGKEALVDMVWYPQVQGAAILCQGADNSNVRAEITEIATVLLGISSNRVTIGKLAEGTN